MATARGQTGIQRTPGRPDVRRPPPLRHPAGVEADYRASIFRILRAARAAVLETLIPALSDLVEQSPYRTDGARADASGVDIALGNTRAVFARKLSPREVERVASKTAGRAASFHSGGFNRQFKAVLGVDVLAAEPWLGPMLADWSEENAGLVRGVADQYMGQVAGVVRQGVRSGKRASSIAGQISKRYNVARGRAKFIARDQVGSLNAALNRERQTGLGVDRYIWRTTTDELVRPDHAALDGTIQRWDSPPVTDTRTGARNHPGEDFNCRCEPEPVISDLLGDVAAEDTGPRAFAKSPLLSRLAKPSRVRPRKRRAPGVPRPPAARPGDRKVWRGPPPGGPTIDKFARRYRPDDPDPERRIYGLIDNWVHGTGRKSSALFAEAARQEMGIEGLVRKSRPWKFTAAELAQARLDVAEIYRRTQAQLKRRGVGKVKLYRGTKNQLASSNVLRSYTTQEEVAKKFDGYGVAVEEVPANRILIWHESEDWHNGVFGEQFEHVVLQNAPTKGKP